MPTATRVFVAKVARLWGVSCSHRPHALASVATLQSSRGGEKGLATFAQWATFGPQNCSSGIFTFWSYFAPRRIPQARSLIHPTLWYRYARRHEAVRIRRSTRLQ